MILRRFCLALLLAVAAAMPAAGQAPPPRVVLTTELGAIAVELDPGAPVTTANFLRYVDGKRFDGIVFYRAMKLD